VEDDARMRGDGMLHSSEEWGNGGTGPLEEPSP
jgi:hypothetical protein